MGESRSDMKESLLSIGEAAKLKNVSIKSLRYYDQIGILTPAYVDPHTNYRYYSAAQMFYLDVITTCTELGIPLKELRNYRRDDNSLDLEGLLSKGASIAHTKIQQAQQSLLQINSALDEMQAQETFMKQAKPFTRTMPKRLVYARPWENDIFNTKSYLNIMSDLYYQAGSINATPLYFQGLLVSSTHKKPDSQDEDLSQSNSYSCLAYVQIEPFPNTQAHSHPHVISIPEAQYKGIRIEDTSLDNCIRKAFLYINHAPGNYSLTEIWDKHLPDNIYVVEVMKQIAES